MTRNTFTFHCLTLPNTIFSEVFKKPAENKEKLVKQKGNWHFLKKAQKVFKKAFFVHFHRESWIIVKKKTADSEREWHALRAEFAARRKLFKSAYHLCRAGGDSSSSSENSSAESGFATDNQVSNGLILCQKRSCQFGIWRRPWKINLFCTQTIFL